MQIGTDTFPASGAGMSHAVEWIHRRTATGKVLVAVEGTSSYGARLTRLLEAERFAVWEARPPRRLSAMPKANPMRSTPSPLPGPSWGRPPLSSSAHGLRV
jgi:hypothetical protein